LTILSFVYRHARKLWIAIPWTYFIVLFLKFLAAVRQCKMVVHIGRTGAIKRKNLLNCPLNSSIASKIVHSGSNNDHFYSGPSFENEHAIFVDESRSWYNVVSDDELWVLYVTTNFCPPRPSRFSRRNAANVQIIQNPMICAKNTSLTSVLGALHRHCRRHLLFLVVTTFLNIEHEHVYNIHDVFILYDRSAYINHNNSGSSSAGGAELRLTRHALPIVCPI